LKEKPKTNRKFFAVSNYTTGSWQLDVDDKIDVKNEKGVLLESIHWFTMLRRFYEQPSVNCYGIICAYIWDVDTQEVVNNVTDLPGGLKKSLIAQRIILNNTLQIRRLQEEIEKL